MGRLGMLLSFQRFKRCEGPPGPRHYLGHTFGYLGFKSVDRARHFDETPP